MQKLSNGRHFEKGTWKIISFGRCIWSKSRLLVWGISVQFKYLNSHLFLKSSSFNFKKSDEKTKHFRVCLLNLLFLNFYPLITDTIFVLTSCIYGDLLMSITISEIVEDRSYFIWETRRNPVAEKFNIYFKIMENRLFFMSYGNA